MAAGIAYTADEEVVILECRFLEAMNVLLLRSAKHWYVVFRLVRMVGMKLRVCCC
jgi:hypothetical protein